MARCIYRKVVLNDNRPLDDDTATMEHIIAWALGGSNNFSTNDASKKGNNDLGSEVDRPFMNCLPSAIERHQLQIKAQSGLIEPIEWDASTDTGANGRVTIHADGRVEFDMHPDVLRDANGNVISVGETKERVVPIFQGFLAKWRKRGDVTSDKDGNVFTSLDDMLYASEVQFIDTFHCRVAYFDREAWTRGILEIVLGLGHLVLGSEWTFGPDGGEILRPYVLNQMGALPQRQIKGFLAGEWARNTRVMLGKTTSIKDNKIHTLAILPAGDRAWAAVSLFGGNEVPEAFIDLGSSAATEKLLGRLDRGDHSIGLGYRINPTTRDVQLITFAEIDSNLARFGPTDKRPIGRMLGHSK